MQQRAVVSAMDTPRPNAPRDQAAKIATPANAMRQVMDSRDKMVARRSAPGTRRFKSVRTMTG